MFTNFKDIDFDYIEIPNEDMRDFWDGVEEIVCQVQTMLAQGRNWLINQYKRLYLVEIFYALHKI